MKVLTISPMNVIVSGDAGQITFLVQAGDRVSYPTGDIFTPDPEYYFTMDSDGCHLNDGTHSCTINGGTTKLEAKGMAQLVVDYKANPYNTPLGTNITIESKLDPAHVFCFNKFTQAVGTGTIDMIGDQPIPPVIYPTWPPKKATVVTKGKK
jgi:hypothetical protein